VPFKRIGQADCEMKSFFMLPLRTNADDFGKNNLLYVTAQSKHSRFREDKIITI